MPVEWPHQLRSHSDDHLLKIEFVVLLLPEAHIGLHPILQAHLFAAGAYTVLFELVFHICYGVIIVLATEKHREEFRNTLQAASNSSIKYIDAVELLSAFMVDGWPNETRSPRTVGRLVQRAALSGPVRLYGVNMVSVLWAEGKTRAAIRLEELWNELASQCAFSLLCAYPMSTFPDQKDNLSFLQVCQTHTHVYPLSRPPTCFLPTLSHKDPITDP